MSQSTEAHPQARQYTESQNRGINDGHHEVGLGLGRPAITTNPCQTWSRNKAVNLTAVTGINNDLNVRVAMRISGLPLPW
jgi:hypothetical protein